MMPQELIFATEAVTASKQLMIHFDGVPLLVEMTDSQDVQVIRVLSTDPQHYMDDRICPGSKISFSNIQGLS
jgi:hypothetical protein